MIKRKKTKRMIKKINKYQETIGILVEKKA